MRYVFGKAFVCKDSNTAQKVAFSDSVKTACVTMEGDLFNPAGTLTGGSRSVSVTILDKIRNLQSAESDLER